MRFEAFFVQFYLTRKIPFTLLEVFSFTHKKIGAEQLSYFNHSGILIGNH